MWSYNNTPDTDYLCHYGVLGMKWGHRKAKYDVSSDKRNKKEGTNDKKKTLTDNQKSSRRKKAIKVGAAVVGTSLAVYGAHKASQYLKSTAGKKSYEAGKRYAEEHFFSKADDTLNDILSGKSGKESLSQFMSLREAGRQTLRNTDKRTKKVSSSTIQAIKYLRDPNSMMVDGDLLRWY